MLSHVHYINLTSWPCPLFLKENKYIKINLILSQFHMKKMSGITYSIHTKIKPTSADTADERSTLWAIKASDICPSGWDTSGSSGYSNSHFTVTGNAKQLQKQLHNSYIQDDVTQQVRREDQNHPPPAPQHDFYQYILLPTYITGRGLLFISSR